MAAEVHEGQFDKAGVPYIFHCFAVMEMAGERVKKDHMRETVMIAAVLHDALEDFRGSVTEKLRLRDKIYELDNRASSAIDALTKYPRQGGYEETYDEYLDRVSADWIARIVKCCDFTHNMDPRRIPASQIVDRDFERWDKYRRGLIRLEREAV